MMEIATVDGDRVTENNKPIDREKVRAEFICIYMKTWTYTGAWGCIEILHRPHRRKIFK